MYLKSIHAPGWYVLSLDISQISHYIVEHFLAEDGSAFACCRMLSVWKGKKSYKRGMVKVVDSETIKHIYSKALIGNSESCCLQSSIPRHNPSQNLVGHIHEKTDIKSYMSRPE